MFIWEKHYPGHRDLACQQARSRYTGKLFVSYERSVTFLKKFINNSRGKYKRNECLINVCKSDKDLSMTMICPDLHKLQL